jgi:pentapeptide MXKDX repeat protein
VAFLLAFISQDIEKRELRMKKLVLISFAFALGLSVGAFAQDTMKQDDTMKNDNMKAEKMSKTSVHLMGKIGEDGKTFVGDKDNKTWKVSNPEALKGHEGHHVQVKAHVDADKDEIHVMSVKMLKSEMKDNDKSKY